jgi:hypothetical protein
MAFEVPRMMQMAKASNIWDNAQLLKENFASHLQKIQTYAMCMIES